MIMTTQEINLLIISIPMVLILLFAVGLVLHHKKEEREMA